MHAAVSLTSDGGCEKTGDFKAIEIREQHARDADEAKDLEKKRKDLLSLLPCHEKT